MPGIDGPSQCLSSSHVAWASVSATQKSIALFLGACTPRSSIQEEQGLWSLPLSFRGLWLPPTPAPLPWVGEARACCRMTLVGGFPLAGVAAASISRVQKCSLYQLSQRCSTLRRQLCNNPNQKRRLYKPDHSWAPDCKCLFIHLYIFSLGQQTSREDWAVSHVSSFEP